ncbi:MAG: hypothetical protein OEZ43_13485 [Gammaproteobacteria bacterium]|nr:hypothetical protein [Gammaproteobacteria bacterium]
MSIRRKYFIVSLILMVNRGAVADSGEFQELPYTKIQKQNPIELMVCAADNPQFKVLSDKDLQTILFFAKKHTKTYLGMDVDFKLQSRNSIKEVFDLSARRAIEFFRPYIFHWKVGSIETDSLKKFIKESLFTDEKYVVEMKKFTVGFLLEDKGDFSDQLVNTALMRLFYWRTAKDKGGNLYVNEGNLNEWLMWQALGYGNNTCDIIITNQLVVSAEYAPTDVHTLIRGGISVGSTFYGKNTHSKKFAFLSTFPFFESHEYLSYLRGDEVYTHQEALELSGTYLVHELGHMLLHLGHPLNHHECVMNPVTMLEFKNWATGLDASECKIGSSKYMTPGTQKIFYFRNL